MNILLFGVSNVGKTTIGKIMAEKLGYSFYDLDDEVKKYYGYKNLDAFLEQNRGKGRFWYFSTKAARRHSEVTYRDGDYLIFGKESAGLPEYLVYGHPEEAVRIPMRDTLRSLNLSNSVAIAVYEALRQLDYPDLR